MLERLRGTTEVDAEFADICEAAEVAQRVSHRQVRRAAGRITGRLYPSPGHYTHVPALQGTHDQIVRNTATALPQLAP